MSDAQFSRVQQALAPLPDTLKSTLQTPDLYASTGNTTQAGQAHAIVLDPLFLVQDSRTDEALRYEILSQFFKLDFDRHFVFCVHASNCPSPSQKEKLLSGMFRGSYLNSKKSGGNALREAYSLHAAAYFSDPDYSCKHPLLASILESTWAMENTTQCQKKLPFLVSESFKTTSVRWIDPHRVYAVQLLFASEAGWTMSQFGHAAIRLVICNDKRIKVDAHCEEDVFDHVSLGFRAKIDEVDLSLWKGVWGGYQIRLYANAFMDTYREYTIDEFRSLYALPMVLTEADKEKFVRALSDVHWSYLNDYRFFTLNCATETEWLLNTIHAAAKNPPEPLFTKNRQRPDSLFSDARQSASFNNTVLANLVEAEKGGYFFSSAEKYYALAVDTVLSTPAVSAEAGKISPDDWARQAPEYRRQSWIKPALSAPQTEEHTQRVVHAALVLEGWVARKLRRELLNSLLYDYEKILQDVSDNKTDLKDADKATLFNCVTTLKAADTLGLDASEIPDEETSIAASQTMRCTADNPELIRIVRQLFEDFSVEKRHRLVLNDLSSTVDNLKLVSDQLVH